MNTHLSFYQAEMLRYYLGSRDGDSEYQGCINHNFLLREYGTAGQANIPLTWFRDRGARIIKRLKELGLLVSDGKKVYITGKGRKALKEDCEFIARCAATAARHAPWQGHP